MPIFTFTYPIQYYRKITKFSCFFFTFVLFDKLTDFEIGLVVHL